MAEAKFLALDLGAESGRAVVGHFDGQSLRLEEIHRFANGPVLVNGHLYWDALRLLSEVKEGIRNNERDFRNVRSFTNLLNDPPLFDPHSRAAVANWRGIRGSSIGVFKRHMRRMIFTGTSGVFTDTRSTREKVLYEEFRKIKGGHVYVVDIAALQEHEQTTIPFVFDETGMVKILIVDAAGYRIKKEGQYYIDDSSDDTVQFYSWNGRDSSGLIVPAGIYVYLITWGNTVIRKGKLAVIR